MNTFSPILHHIRNVSNIFRAVAQMFLFHRSPFLIHAFGSRVFPGCHWTNTCRGPELQQCAWQGMRRDGPCREHWSPAEAPLPADSDDCGWGWGRPDRGGWGWGHPDRGAWGQGPQRSTFINCCLPNYPKCNGLYPRQSFVFSPGFCEQARTQGEKGTAPSGTVMRTAA